MTAFRLPCDCGSELLVETRHAGQTLNCPSCGAAVDVPQLLQLRRLPPAEDTAAGPLASRRSTSSVPAGGCLFSLTVVVLIAALLATLVLAIVAVGTNPGQTIESDIAAGESFIDETDPAQLFEIWQEIRDVRPGTPTPPPYVFYAERSRWFRNLAIVACTIALVAGLAVALQVGMALRKPSG